MIETKVSAAKKDNTSQVRKEVEVHKEWLDGTENLVQGWFPTTCQTETNELKAQLDDMPSQNANLTMQPPLHALPESLMQMLNQSPPIQLLDEICGEELQAKSKKRKHNTCDLDQQTHFDPLFEAQWSS